jgi:hypothetical protein
VCSLVDQSTGLRGKIYQRSERGKKREEEGGRGKR